MRLLVLASDDACAAAQTRDGLLSTARRIPLPGLRLPAPSSRRAAAHAHVTMTHFLRPDGAGGPDYAMQRKAQWSGTRDELTPHKTWAHSLQRLALTSTTRAWCRGADPSYHASKFASACCCSARGFLVGGGATLPVAPAPASLPPPPLPTPPAPLPGSEGAAMYLPTPVRTCAGALAAPGLLNQLPLSWSGSAGSAPASCAANQQHSGGSLCAWGGAGG